MKNIHILPTTPNDETANGIWIKETRDWCNIYITNDEGIKEGEYVVEIITSPRKPYIGKTFYPKNDGTVTEEYLKKHLLSVNFKGHYETIAHKGNCSKIILTTDQDLIKDGVQAIDDEFLEWFVNNPSCEFVEVKKGFEDGSAYGYNFLDYKIIIPKEEPKQETPEKIEKYVPSEYRPKNLITDTKVTFIGGMSNNIKTHDVQFISPNSYKVKFFAIDPDLLSSDVQHEIFSKSDLISFGNYLLSKEREEMVTSKPERGVAECAVVIRQVSDADFENWRIKK